MKTNYRLINIAFAFIAICMVCSCGKNIFEQDYAGYGGKVLMAQAADGRNVIPVTMSSKPSKLGFGAFYGMSMGPSPKDIPVEFALKEDWIQTYNQANNTDYVPLPAGSYTITGLTSVIKQGTTTSEPLSITIESKKLDVAKKYMFPITLVSAGGEKVDSALRTAWFRIDNIVRPERDVTSQGTLSVSKDNNGGPNAGEGSAKLIDNNVNSKFLVFDINTVLPNFWYQLSFPNAVSIGAYTMTSGDDAPERDPKDWQLLGSNDGTSWTTLDTRGGQSFSARKMTTRYETNNATAYKYYRLAISAINGGTLFQQAEWRLIEYYEQ